MKHPNDEQLAGFLYDDYDDVAERGEVEQHLAACADCRRRVASWRAVRRELGVWHPSVATERQPNPVTVRARRWWLLPLAGRAAAAAVLLAAGYGLGRAAFVRVELPRLRTELTSQIRSEMDAKLGAFAAEQTTERRAFQRSMGEALAGFSARHAAEQAALRRDVETVALASQEEFNRLERASEPSPAGPQPRPTTVPTP